MVKNLPSSRKEDKSCKWLELMVGLNHQDAFRGITQEFWIKIVPKLNRFNDIRIDGPDDFAWFHLRRSLKKNEDDILQYSNGRIELLRLKKDIIDKKGLEEIRLMAGQHKDVICAGWWERNFAENYDSAFWSFLQKLSNMRMDSLAEADRWLDDLEALNLMTSRRDPWFAPLKPWFERIFIDNPDEGLIWEYAHWFSHILSGWKNVEMTRLERKESVL